MSAATGYLGPEEAIHLDRRPNALAWWFFPWLLSTASHLGILLLLALLVQNRRGVDNGDWGQEGISLIVSLDSRGGADDAAGDDEASGAEVVASAAEAPPQSTTATRPEPAPEIELHPEGELAAAAEVPEPVELDSIAHNVATSDRTEPLTDANDATGARRMLRQVEESSSGHGGGSGTSIGLGSGNSGINAALAKGAARTGVFGVSGIGYKFVYVFDRSGSMDGHGGAPLAAAKSELIHSLHELDKMHQFQIVFYNEHPRVFTLSGNDGRLAFGTQQNKRLAERFVRGITADGATQHEEAILLALAMDPDVIFFLTDADEPSLSPRQLAHIARRNHGTTINTIEFGYGPQENSENFLGWLARQNGGQHVYVNIANLPQL
jgi:hypothetical protein